MYHNIAKGKNASLSLAFHENVFLCVWQFPMCLKHKPGKIYPLRPRVILMRHVLKNNQAWDAALGSVEVFGGSNEDHEEFYSHLYHA